MLARHIIFFSILLCSFSFAQLPENLILRRADSLFSSGRYFDAITEYKRSLFFQEPVNYFYSYSQIGKCYKAGAYFDLAVENFSSAYRQANSPDEKFNTQIEIIRCNILRGTLSRALELCAELERSFNEEEKLKQINYWRGWAYMFSDDWESASGAFASIEKNHELKLLADRVMDEKVSVTFATVISYILPGAGQIYSGEILSGLMSLGWNLLAGYLTVTAAVENRVFDSVALGELLWLRFYRGNVQNAAKFASDKNLQIAGKALKFLQNEYRGLKP